MFSAAELIDSYTPVTAIAVVFVALSLAGCSAGLSRFDNNPFSRAVQTAEPAGGLGDVVCWGGFWFRRKIRTST